MKLNLIIFIPLVLCLLLISTGFIFSKNETVRSVNLIVIDSFDNKPVSNALVYYEIVTVRQRTFLGIPLIDPLYYRNVVQEMYYTDNDGQLFIPAHQLKLSRHEEVFREYISINLDKPDNFFKGNAEKLFNPIAHLKGAIIESSKTELDPTEYKPYSNEKKFEHLLYSKSLLKESERMEIRLRRWKE